MLLVCPLPPVRIRPVDVAAVWPLRFYCRRPIYAHAFSCVDFPTGLHAMNTRGTLGYTSGIRAVLNSYWELLGWLLPLLPLDDSRATYDCAAATTADAAAASTTLLGVVELARRVHNSTPPVLYYREERERALHFGRRGAGVRVHHQRGLPQPGRAHVLGRDARPRAALAAKQCFASGHAAA